MPEKVHLEMILDHLGDTAVYVITREDHRILYFNRRVQQVTPEVRLGTPCSQLWGKNCAYCPLNNLGEKRTNTVIAYHHTFGEAVDITATKVYWEQVPSFLITITPRTRSQQEIEAELNQKKLAAVAAQLYPVIFSVNLTRNEYSMLALGASRISLPEENGSVDTMVELFSRILHPESKEAFCKTFSRAALCSAFNQGNRNVVGEYQALYRDEQYHWIRCNAVLLDNPENDDLLELTMFRNIDQEKQGELWLLHEREALYNSIPGSVVKCVLGENILLKDASEGFFQMFGDLRQPGGMNQAILEEDRAATLSLLYGTAGRREAISCEFRMRCQDESIVWVRCVGKHLGEDAAGPIYQLLLLDVTDQHLAWQELQQERLRYRLAVESSADIVFEYSFSSDCLRLQYGDTHQEKMLEDYLKKLPENFRVLPEHRTALLELFTGKRARAEILVRSSLEVEYRWLLGQGTAVLSETGEVRRVVGTFRDIDALRRQEAHLNQQLDAAKEESKTANRRFATAVLRLYDAIYEGDLITGELMVWKNGENNMTFAPPGTTLMEHFQRICQQCIHPDYREQFQQMFHPQKALNAMEAGKTTLDMDLIALCGENLWRWYGIQMQLLERSEKSIRVMIYFRDIDELKRSQQRQQQALQDALQLAERASAAKSDFLSRMSHDIRTPMNAIIGMTAIAQANLDDPQRVEDCLSKISTSSRYLLSLINDILDMSKIESGKMNVNAAVFDFYELIQNLTSICNNQAQQKEQDFTIFVDERIERHYRADSLRLNQILLNLISNALKYTPAKGTIRLRADLLRQQRESALLRFQVQDNGIGMSEEFMSRIFKPFEQEQQNTGRVFEGTGLGLAITHSLVLMMGGHIDVSSTPGQGSLFTVELPLGRVPEEDSEDILPLEEDLSVLVVDDDPAMCQYTVHLLTLMKVHSEWVTSGQQALEQIQLRQQQGKPYNVALVDWKMPEMDGLTTVQHIQRLSKKIKIIMMSSYDWSDIEAEVQQAGISHFIPKPIFPDTLRSVLCSKIKSSAEAETAEQNIFNGQRVLLVEDNQLNLEIAQTLLEMKNIIVETAENGQLGVDRFCAAPSGWFRAVLMDIRMPVMDGLEAARQIRRKDSKVPIIAMTANAFQNEEYEARQAGMNGYLTKPVDAQKLYDTLEEIFSRS